MASIIWFRQDLRLADQAAVVAAAAEGAVVPVYVLDDETPGRWHMGAAQRWWLYHSLASLDADLHKLGARLVLLRGSAGTVLPGFARTIGAAAIHALAHYEPWSREQERQVGAAVPLRLYPGLTLAPPARIRSGAGGRYRIFTPFWRALKDQMPPSEPLPAPSLRMAEAPAGEALDDWRLRPTRPDWAASFAQRWTPGEAGAWKALGRFIEIAADYEEGRNFPAKPGSSRLSPHLHMGELSPAQIWHALGDAIGIRAEPFLREVGWRDFAIGLVDQFPDTHERPWRAVFERFPHRSLRDPDARADLKAWQHGRTGYPIVDAGMRELWTTGWMHNRVRMIAASFLVKHLLIDWREGFRWFWETLVDADLSNNALGWQWIMGSGVDSSPFARIFAPVGQGRKFDPDGEYVCRWVPELSRLPSGMIHQPWEADPPTLTAAGVRLGDNYPRPMIDHSVARRRALDAYGEAKARLEA